MKRTTIHIFAALALLLGLAACTQDEAGFLPEGAEGTSIVFTATGLNPASTAIAGTRAPVDGNWEGVQSVAVLMDGTVKAYDVTLTTADPTSATLTSTDPYYWTNHNDITVTAWWPYTAGETTPPAVKVKANQSAQKDFEGSDLIVADGQKVTYGSPTLRFTHRTARVTIVLTDYTEGLASVQLTGLSTEGDNPDIIVPYDKGSNTYTAIVAPQSVAAGTTFITCTFTNGKTLVYKMKNATDWQAGGEYTYTVSLAAARGYIIEDDGSYTVTSADGLMNIAELVNGGKSDINITLDTDIDLTGKDWTPIGTDYDNSYKGTFDGGGHTITGLIFTTNDEYAGLFGYLNRAGTVKNVVMEGVQITSNQISGGTLFGRFRAHAAAAGRDRGHLDRSGGDGAGKLCQARAAGDRLFEGGIAVSRNTKTVLALLAAVLVLAVVPFFLAPGAEFGGSDDAGSRMVEEIQGEAYEPWFTPVLETLLGGELPGEIESLLFCIQTGVGVGVLAYGFGYFVARKKYSAQSVE